MTYLNLTPHAIRIINEVTGSETVIEPSGTLRYHFGDRGNLSADWRTNCAQGGWSSDGVAD